MLPDCLYFQAGFKSHTSKFRLWQVIDLAQQNCLTQLLKTTGFFSIKETGKRTGKWDTNEQIDAIESSPRTNHNECSIYSRYLLTSPQNLRKQIRRNAQQTGRLEATQFFTHAQEHCLGLEKFTLPILCTHVCLGGEEFVPLANSLSKGSAEVISTCLVAVRI